MSPQVKSAARRSSPSPRPQVLVIAGSDPSGGAGLQGDIATLSYLGCCPLAVPSALTVQAPRGVRSVHALSAKSTFAAVKRLLSDFEIHAIKIGMLHDVATLRAVARALQNYAGPVVMDPILRPTRGQSLSTHALPEAMLAELWPLLDVGTPNLPEAEYLCGLKLETLEMRIAAAQALCDLGCGAVLLKGGHADDALAVDVLAEESGLAFLTGPRRQSSRNHGTGCALSSAIAAGFAFGHDTQGACLFGKQALDAALNIDHVIGKGNHSVAHAAMPRGSAEIEIVNA